MKTIKKILAKSVVVGVSLYLIACSPCLTKSNYFVSQNAHSLVDSYRDLVKFVNSDSTCTYNDGKTIVHRRCTYSAMPTKGYLSNLKGKGYISFSSFYVTSDNTVPNETIPFNSLWISDSLKAYIVSVWANCVACYPKPIVYPIPTIINGIGTQNGVFEVILVPVSTYQAGMRKDYLFSNAANATNPMLSIVIKAADIKAINELYMEKEGGYMSKNLPLRYNDINSSVGIVCNILLNNGNRVECYIFNNYDGGTLLWKEQITK